MKYLFIYWLFLLPLCITAINLEPWMPASSQKKAKQERRKSNQELMMNPLFIFK